MSKTLRSKRFVSDAYAFLEKQLEIIDPVIKEPLSGTDWPRDMPVRTGGGFVENVSVIDVSYASTGGETEDAIFVENGNDIPILQADFNKEVARVFNFQEYMRIGYVEQQKFRKLATNLEDTMNKGIRLHLDKVIDKSVYRGFSKAKSTGLVNNANITRTTADPHTALGSDTQWKYKTADEILADVNAAIAAVWEANDCAADGLPNHILVPVEQFGSLVSRKVSHDSERSILTFILENNIATQQGGSLIISPSKFCKGAGADSTDRMVVYINDEERIRFTLSVPLQRLDTEIRNMAFHTPFVSQFSEVQFVYPTTVLYVDGI